MTGTEASADAAGNRVQLVGRVSGEPQERELPSGDRIVTFVVVVDRHQPRGRQRVDVIDCVAWGGRVRRSVSRWCEGDVCEVEGALRRRFYRAGGGTVSRVEVEVDTARLIRRGASA